MFASFGLIWKWEDFLLIFFPVWVLDALACSYGDVGMCVCV